MIKRISLLIAAALLAAVLTIGGAAPAFASPPACSPGEPGCKTNCEYKNDKFCESQRGNQSAPGTEGSEQCFQEKHGTLVQRNNCPGGQSLD